MNNDSKILYRISKEDAEASGMNMKEFYQKRRKGLYPFRDDEETIEWLSNNEFRIVAVKKRIGNRDKNKKKKRGKRSGAFFTKEMVNAFVITGSGIIILYFIVKLIQVLQIF